MIQDNSMGLRATRQVRCWTRWALHEYETIAARRLTRRARLWGTPVKQASPDCAEGDCRANRPLKLNP